MEIKYKQFIILPRKPKMSKGKLVSQGCHAAFMALENQRDLINKAKNIKPPEQHEYTKHIIPMQEWKLNGELLI